VSRCSGHHFRLKTGTLARAQSRSLPEASGTPSECWCALDEGVSNARLVALPIRMMRALARWSMREGMSHSCSAPLKHVSRHRGRVTKCRTSCARDAALRRSRLAYGDSGAMHRSKAKVERDAEGDSRARRRSALAKSGHARCERETRSFANVRHDAVADSAGPSLCIDLAFDDCESRRHP
jgi:hypothetical protein